MALSLRRQVLRKAAPAHRHPRVGWEWAAAVAKAPAEKGMAEVTWLPPCCCCFQVAALQDAADAYAKEVAREMNEASAADKLREKARVQSKHREKKRKAKEEGKKQFEEKQAQKAAAKGVTANAANGGRILDFDSEDSLDDLDELLKGDDLTDDLFG